MWPSRMGDIFGAPNTTFDADMYSVLKADVQEEPQFDQWDEERDVHDEERM
eukprot:NODE_2517_length_683_cov_80.659306_g2059_i0.p4 GENE.NODE_2517_length_683_cov_80.659306_g2059_i0~~NODE_2517_length_683_cov_80.659306_g2059_i0.p4  ORF type:complete len:51 (-),score=18.66 NODE_2517_length_683_cov_80.659306_g2059_i0:427-579(-)